MTRNINIRKRRIKTLLCFTLCLALILGTVTFTPFGSGAVIGGYIDIEGTGGWMDAFYDDFQGTALDADKWYSGGTVAVSNGLTVGSGGSVNTLRTFSAEDVRITYTFSGGAGTGASLSSVFAINDFDGGARQFWVARDNATGNLVVSNGADTLDYAAYIAGSEYTMEITIGNGEAACVLYDNLFTPIWSPAATVPFDCPKYRLSLEEFSGASTAYSEIAVEMLELIYMGDVFGDSVHNFDDDFQDGLWTAPPYTPPANPTRDVYMGPVTGANTGNLSNPTFTNTGWFLRTDSTPYQFQFRPHSNDDVKYTGENLIWLNKIIPLNDHNVVIDFEAYRREMWGGGIGFAIARAEDYVFEFNQAAGGWLCNVELRGDTRMLLYRHFDGQEVDANWYDVITGDDTAKRLRNIWLRHRIEISDSEIKMSVYYAEGPDAGELIVEEITTLYGEDMVLGLLFNNCSAEADFRSLSIKGVPGERGEEVSPPPKYPGADVKPDSDLYQPVISMLDSDSAYTLIDPAMQGVYDSISRQIPDTLDLADRGALAAQGLTNFLDVNASEGARSKGDYAPYGHSILGTNQPFLTSYWGPLYGGGRPNWGKITEATIMARNMSGNRDNLGAQMQSLINSLYFTIADDNYILPDGDTYKDIGVNNYMDHYAVSPLSRIMLTLNSLYSLNAGLMNAADEAYLSDLIDEIAQAHFYNATYVSEYDSSAMERTFLYGANLMRSRNNDFNAAGNRGYEDTVHIDGNALRALSRWGFLDAGSSAAMGLNKEVTKLFRNFLMLPESMTEYKLWEPEIDDIGRREPVAANSYDSGTFSGHVHSYAIALLGLLEYGMYQNDTAVLEFVRSSYEYYRTYGITAIGAFGESCATGEMTAVAVWLSRFGVGDYWDDVDRYVRNHLAEIQITDEKVDQFEAKLGIMLSPTTAKGGQYTDAFNSDGVTSDVLNRVKGTFITDSAHPIYVPEGNQECVICCTGNATQGLYYAWESIVTEQGGVVSVNLPLNRASKWLDVDSYLPYEGKVELYMREDVDAVDFRVPNYVDSSTLTVMKNGSPADFYETGNRILLTDLLDSDVITIGFDIENWEEAYRLKWLYNRYWPEGADPRQYAGDTAYDNAPEDIYTITFRANTVIDIDCSETADKNPNNRDLLLYNGADRKAALDGAAAPMKSGVTRYIPNTTLKP